LINQCSNLALLGRPARGWLFRHEPLRSRRLRDEKATPRQGLFLEAMRFEGERWKMFGELIEGGSVQE